MILALGKCFPVIACNKLYSREWLLQKGLIFVPGIPHGEDYLFSFQSLANAHRIGFLERITYAYRQHSMSFCAKYGRRETLKYLSVFAHLFAELPVCSPASRKWAVVELETKRNNIIADAVYYLNAAECTELLQQLRRYRFPYRELLFSRLPLLRKGMILIFYQNIPLCRLIHKVRLKHIYVKK